jgi:hypothetical protein
MEQFINIRTLPKHTVEEVVKKLSRNSEAGSYPEVDTEQGGYIVAFSKEYSSPKEVVNSQEFKYFKDSGIYVGWYTHKNGKKVYEMSTRLKQLFAAISLGKETKQYSVWDVKNNREIVI